MTIQLTIAILASLTSLFVSLLTFLQSKKNMLRQREEFNKTMTRNVTSKLLDLRIQNYPRAIEITDSINREKGGQLDLEKMKNALLELNKWRTGIVRLIISSESQIHLYDLREALKKKPSNVDSYSLEQVERIWKLRNLLRQSLRDDVGVLHLEDNNDRKNPMERS